MRIVFLDRDGVINRFPGNGGYVTKIKDFHFLPGSLRAIHILTQKGFKIFVVSNQAGVNRGIYSQKKLDQITKHMMKYVLKARGKIRQVFYCTHTPDENCDCRKPKIGSLQRAFKLVGVKPKGPHQSFFVGDAKMDIEAGSAAGCTTILVLSGKENRQSISNWTTQPDHIAKDLLAATKIITDENSSHSRLRRRWAH